MSSKFSTRPSLDRTTVSNAKFEINKLDGINNFGIWQYKLLWISWSNKSWILLWKDKPKEISNKDGIRITLICNGTLQNAGPFGCVF